MEIHNVFFWLVALTFHRRTIFPRVRRMVAAISCSWITTRTFFWKGKMGQILATLFFRRKYSGYFIIYSVHSFHLSGVKLSGFNVGATELKERVPGPASSSPNLIAFGTIFFENNGMRFPMILPAVVVSLFLAGFVSAREASDSGLHTFYGEVVAIDQAKKVIQLKTGNQRFLFHYNDQTKISSTNGHVRLDRITRGTEAVVIMRVGEGNAGIAVVIRFVPGASQLKTLSLISAKTVRGETVTGIAVHNFVDYQPPADAWSGGTPLERRNNVGVFVLSVAPDGTVSSVTLRKSTGYPELDARAEKWMKKWRFHPNSVTEVQLPMYFSQYRR